MQHILHNDMIAVTKASEGQPAKLFRTLGSRLWKTGTGRMGRKRSLVELGLQQMRRLQADQFAGVQVGYDTQFSPNWVFGLEANYSFLDTNGVNRGLGSMTGPLGYTWGPALLYAKGGYAWADTRHTNGFGGGTFSDMHIGRDGYIVGGGLEYMFTQNWSGKIEYQYYNFGTTTALLNIVTPVRFTNDEHTIKAGLNYRFNWGGQAASGTDLVKIVIKRPAILPTFLFAPTNAPIRNAGPSARGPRSIRRGTTARLDGHPWRQRPPPGKPI
jgi:outer membrane immunogenic protein